MFLSRRCWNEPLQVRWLRISPVGALILAVDSHRDLGSRSERFMTIERKWVQSTPVVLTTSECVGVTINAGFHST